MSEFLDGWSLLKGKWFIEQRVRTKIIHDFELLNLIKDGLQPYDQAGEPIDIETVNKMFEEYRNNKQRKSLGLSWDVNCSIKYYRILGNFLFKKHDFERLGLFISYEKNSEVAVQETSENKQENTEAIAWAIGDYVFRQESDIHEIVFAGKPLPPKKLNGLSHIHNLMKKHPEKLIALEVEAMLRGIPEDYVDKKYKEELEEITPIKDPILDQPGLNKVREEMKDLKEELKKYQDDNDYENENITRQKIEELEIWVLREYGPMFSDPAKRRKDPKDSEYTDQLEKARKRVSNAINTAIKWMKKNDKNLGEHFDKSIEKGAYLCYRPQKQFNWHLE